MRVEGGPRFCRERDSEMRNLDCVCAKTAGCEASAEYTACEVGRVNEAACARIIAAGQ